MGTHRVDKKAVSAERKLLDSQFVVEEREIVREMLVLLRSAHDPTTFRELYVKLFARAYALQNAADEIRSDRDGVRAEIQQARADSAAPVALKQLSERLNRIDVGAYAVAAARGIYRSIADALVWRALGYDRATISVLGGGSPVARFSQGKGFEAEVAQIEELWAGGTFAIHNDLTNCLRLGDVTAFEFHAGRTDFSIYEVKAGKARRVSRQADRLRRAGAVINHGSHPAGRPDGRPLQAGIAPVDYRTFAPEFADLVRQARTETYVCAQLAPEVAIEVYDETGPTPLTPTEIDSMQAEWKKQIGFDDETDVQVYSAAARRIRDRRPNHVFPALAPLPLLPLSIDDLTDLLVGRLDYVTTVSASALEKRFADQGIEVDIATAKDAEQTFLTATRGNASVTVPAYVHEQMTVELMKPDVLVDMVDWFLAEAEHGRTASSAALGFANEASVWTPPDGDTR